MSAVKKERTPEQIAEAKARMAAVRARKGSKPKSLLKKGHRSADPVLLEREDLRSASIPDELEGITVNDCPDACRIERCVISGAAQCIHPLKSGIQSAFQMKQDVVERYAMAKKILAHKKIDMT